MPARYVHLVNADVDEAIFKHYGIQNDQIEKSNLPTICHVCNTPNPVNSKICSKCGRPLDLKIALEMEQQNKVENEDRINTLENKIELFEKIFEKSGLTLGIIGVSKKDSAFMKSKIQEAI